MRHRGLMRYYQPFPAAIPLCEAGYPRVTHPSATKLRSIRKHHLTPFDLHVLGTPPAFILSQDQTLMLKSLLNNPRLFFLARILWLSIFVCFANISGFYCFVWVGSFEPFCSLKFSCNLLQYLEFSGLHYCLFVKVLGVVKHRTEKEGFEPSRRY